MDEAEKWLIERFANLHPHPAASAEEAFARALRHIRVSAKKAQEDITVETGVAQSTMSKIEKDGGNTLTAILRLYRIMQACNIRMDFTFEKM